ncbi:hypothetical protein LB505_004966 [Fusarium chuoi]|nr:hypothetical protein LB505_004966 [Fusarium chuoi]
MEDGSDVTNHLKVQLLVRAYQSRGHHTAKIDPLGIRGTNDAKGFSNIKPKELTLEHYGFTEKDMDTEYTLGPGILPRFKRDGQSTAARLVLSLFISLTVTSAIGSVNVLRSLPLSSTLSMRSAVFLTDLSGVPASSLSWPPSTPTTSDSVLRAVRRLSLV